MQTVPSAARIGGIAGVASIAVAAIGLGCTPIWDFPATNTSRAALSAFVVDHRTRLQVTMAMYAIGIALWLLFGVAAAAHLRHVIAAHHGAAGAADSGVAALLRCFAAGITGFVTLLLAGFTALDVLIYRAPHVGDPVLLYDLTFGLLAMSGLPTAIALGAYAVLVQQTGALPRPTAYLAGVTAVAHVVLLLSFVVTGGFFSLEGQVITVVPALLWAWILVTGVALLAVRPNVIAQRV